MGLHYGSVMFVIIPLSVVTISECMLSPSIHKVLAFIVNTAANIALPGMLYKFMYQEIIEMLEIDSLMASDKC